MVPLALANQAGKSKNNVRLMFVKQTNKSPALLRGLVLYGAGTKNRTRDLLITSQLLYQLSYTGVLGAKCIDFYD